jgi:hypothetical protein
LFAREDRVARDEGDDPGDRILLEDHQAVVVRMTVLLAEDADHVARHELVLLLVQVLVELVAFAERDLLRLGDLPHVEEVGVVPRALDEFGDAPPVVDLERVEVDRALGPFGSRLERVERRRLKPSASGPLPDVGPRWV